MKYLEISASLSAALVDFRLFVLSNGILDEFSGEFLGLSRREVRNVISEKVRSGT